MKDYPLEKYKFIHVEKDGRHKVIALSTFAGKRVRGVAVCHENDEFDLEYGKKLAAARCNFKVAQKRKDRAWNKVAETYKTMLDAEDRYIDAGGYYDSACDGFESALLELNYLLGTNN